MGYLISAGASYHWVRQISASTHGDGVLKLTLHGDRDASEIQFNRAEVLIFTDDVEMTSRMVAAINGAAKAREEEPAADAQSEAA